MQLAMESQQLEDQSQTSLPPSVRQNFKTLHMTALLMSSLAERLGHKRRRKAIFNQIDFVSKVKEAV